MIALVYESLKIGVLGYIAYIILRFFKQITIANLIKPITILSLALLVLPVLSRLNTDINSARQDIRGVSNAVKGLSDTITNVKDITGSIDNSSIINYGAPPKLPGRSLIEYFTGGKLDWPVKGEITQGFSETNHGLDIAADAGTAIHSARDGRVRKVGKNNTYGNYILVDHGGGFQTLYAHCNKVYVKNGQNIWTKDTIATIGSTGKSTGPHLHFEVRYTGKAIDPISYLP